LHTDGFTQAAWMLQSGIDHEQAEASDQFGLRLAAGDFDGDGDADLAVGAPFEDRLRLDGSTAKNAGVVHIALGGEDGLVAARGTLGQRSQLMEKQRLDDAANEAMDNEWFGFRLSASDLDGDG
jgi:hypothetical protein